MAKPKQNLKLIWAIALIEIALFLFLRFYNIKGSLFFFNDMGRDLSVLQQWRDTNRPPLLGPQTSALPFNQSALYFYLLYPSFLITNQSPLSALYTNAFVYIFFFTIGLVLLKKHHQLQLSLLAIFFLISIHPQYIIQSRFVWNPSLATPFIITSIYSLLLANPLIFCLSIATALSLTYSVLPFFISACLYFFSKTKHKIKFIFYLLASLLATNLPTIAFELRHNFILTRSIFTQKSPTQQNISLIDKLINLNLYVFEFPSLFYFIPAFIILLFILFTTKNKHQKTAIALFIVTLILNLILPVTLQAHYIFALTSLLFVTISFLKPKLNLLLLIFLAFSYLTPSKLNQYFQDAPRTYQQMAICYQNYCQQQDDPVFVTVQSSYHPYHHGPEHRYLLKKSGCQVVDIEDNSNTTNTMALVVDGGNFDPDKTKFYELDLFGPFTVDSTFICQDNLKILNLKKNEP